MTRIRILVLLATLFAGLLLPATAASGDESSLSAPTDVGPLTPDDPGFGV